MADEHRPARLSSILSTGGETWKELQELKGRQGLPKLPEWLGMLAGPPGARALCGATALAASLTVGLTCRRFMGLSPLVGPLLPVGALMLAVALVRSVWVTLRQGGVRWRGSLYPLSDLKAFSRAED